MNGEGAKLRITPGALVLALLLIYDGSGVLLMIAASVALHELGHYAALRARGAEVRGMSVGLTGFCITYWDEGSYTDEIITAAAGPAVSLLVSAASAALYRIVQNDALVVFAGINISYCIFNLLPALPLDGGRVLSALLSLLFDWDTAYRLMCLFSCVTGGGLLIAGAYLMFASGWNFMLMAAGALIILNYCKSS